MVKYTNFYETVKEAELRLNNTLILYEGEPHYVYCVADHKSDGIFRIYMEKIGERQMTFHYKSVPVEWHPEVNAQGVMITKGDKMDEFMEKQGKDNKIIRKMMNSPAFNKFRPFPLGMVNTGGSVQYVERTPQRHTQQGLTQDMVVSSTISLMPDGKPLARGGGLFSIFDRAFYDCIVGNYPSADECLQNLKDKDVLNRAVAFHRGFAFVRGPIGTLFLAHRQEIVGMLPNKDLSELRLSNKTGYLREIVEDLKLFKNIVTVD